MITYFLGYRYDLVKDLHGSLLAMCLMNFSCNQSAWLVPFQQQQALYMVCTLYLTYHVAKTSFCKFTNFSSSKISRKYDSCMICLSRKMSLSIVHAFGLGGFWYDVFSMPSGVMSLSTAIMQPCVSFREFSMTSTPN